MKELKKLVLASAILAASSSSFAMQAMDEEAMSATTGQDGLTVTLNTNLTGLGIKYIDRDGVTGGAYANAGGIIISPVGITMATTGGLTINIDAGGSTAAGTSGTGMLQVAVGSSVDTVINLNNTKISVADADATGSATGTATDIITFSSSASLTIASNANLATIQLGNETQGAMIRVNANLGNIVLTGLSIVDAGGANSGGSITLDTLTVNNLNAVNSIDVVTGGLRIDTAGTTIGTVALEGVHLGTASSASIGDVYISNLNPSTVITVTGH